MEWTNTPVKWQTVRMKIKIVIIMMIIVIKQESTILAQQRETL